MRSTLAASRSGGTISTAQPVSASIRSRPRSGVATSSMPCAVSHSTSRQVVWSASGVIRLDDDADAADGFVSHQSTFSEMESAQTLPAEARADSTDCC